LSEERAKSRRRKERRREEKPRKSLRGLEVRAKL